MTRSPILIDLEDLPEKGVLQTPATAPPVPDDGMGEPAPEGRAMQAAAALAAGRPSRAARWFWAAIVGFLGLVLSLAVWDYLNALLARQPVLAFVALGLLGVAVLAALVLAAREWAAFNRLRRLDVVRRAAEAARTTHDLAGARAAVAQLDNLYAPRAELRWPRARLTERMGEILDVGPLLDLAEAELLAPLDAEARRAVEGAARQVATVTAFVPLALADVAAALLVNMRMIRRIAEIYGGRSGTLGGWRLTRSVLAHLVATGAVAVGDDLVSSLAGGGLVAKLSRRFGEGVVNGALTARVGIAAIDVCRPLPFSALPRPRTTALVSRALTGLFGRGA
jgi:putative membrane protein